MNKNTIEIRIVVCKGKQLLLELSPYAYKQQFREFVQKHQLSHQQAFQLKTAIQMELVKASRTGSKQKDLFQEMPKFETFNRIELENEQLLNKSKGKDKASINFHNNCEESQKSTDVHNGLSKNFQIQQKLPTFSNFQVQEQKSEPQKQRPLQQQYNIQSKIQPEQLEPSQYKKINYVHYPNLQIPHSQKRSRSPSEEVYGRLYQNRTASFNNKRKEQVNTLQELDYLQVQKYQFNNSLKRTTNSFFKGLSHHQTVAFSKKKKQKTHIIVDNQKHQSPEKSSEHRSSTPTRKRSPCFGLSPRQSGARCEMKEQIKRRQKQLSQSRIKQDRIRQRIKEQDSTKKIDQKLQSQNSPHKTCYKCHPKVEAKPHRRQNKKKPCDQKVRGRPYVSNLLKQCYNEFVRDVSRL